MARSIIRWLAPLLVLGALLTATVSAQAASGTRLRANLTGSSTFSAVTGKAVYKQDGTERQLQVEIENANRLAGRTLIVKVNGARVGTMTVNNLGVARLIRNTNLGQAVPTIAPGSSITVTTGGGALVASGTFHRAA